MKLDEEMQFFLVCVVAAWTQKITDFHQSVELINFSPNNFQELLICAFR